MKVVIAARWQQPGCAEVCAAYPQVEFAVARTPEELVREAANAEVIFGWPHAGAIRAAPRLRWVQAHSAGMDWMTGLTELIESDITVTHMGGVFAPTMIEHTFALLLALTRRLPHLSLQQGRHSWSRPPDFQAVGLAGSTLGIVGFGNIGRGVGRVGHALGMRIVAVDLQATPPPEYPVERRGLEALPWLLTDADAVVVTVPLTPATAGMLDAARLALMKPSAYLIVVSRGGIVDEASVARMLREGRLAGAGLDVFAAEPLPPESTLWDTPNLIVTPHSSAFSRQTTDGCWQVWKENLGRYLEGRPLLNVFDKRRGY